MIKLCVGSDTTRLSYSDAQKMGGFDRAGRWHPDDDIAEYYVTIRAPSRAWPNSYLKATMTKKFLKWAIANNHIHTDAPDKSENNLTQTKK